MKKLMIAAAALAVGFAAQAANYNWSMDAGWITPDEENGLEGAKVYFYNAGVTDQSELMKNLTMANIEASALTIVGGNIYTTTGSDGNFSVWNPTDNKNFIGGDVGDTASMFALLLADANDKTYAYVLTPTDDVTIGSSHASGSPLAFTIDDTITGEIGGAGWTQVGGAAPTPEPTSGLLLLLGVAGLTLRRRRA